MDLTFKSPQPKDGLISLLKVGTVVVGGVIFSTVAFLATILLFELNVSNITQTVWLPATTVIQGAVFTLVGLVYVKLTDSIDWSRTYSIPNKRDMLFVLYGTVGLFLISFVSNAILQLLEIQSAENMVSQVGAENPTVMLLMIPVAILVIGVYEEFIFRAIAHETFRPLFGTGGAIVISAVLFSLIHASSLIGSGIVPTLVVLFGLGAFLGYLYERTENIVVPMLVHGLYDAILFGSLYVTQTGMGPSEITAVIPF